MNDVGAMAYLNNYNGLFSTEHSIK